MKTVDENAMQDTQGATPFAQTEKQRALAEQFDVGSFPDRLVELVEHGRILIGHCEEFCSNTDPVRTRGQGDTYGFRFGVAIYPSEAPHQLRGYCTEYVLNNMPDEKYQALLADFEGRSDGSNARDGRQAMVIDDLARVRASSKGSLTVRRSVFGVAPGRSLWVGDLMIRQASRRYIGLQFSGCLLGSTVRLIELWLVA